MCVSVKISGRKTICDSSWEWGEQCAFLWKTLGERVDTTERVAAHYNEWKDRRDDPLRRERDSRLVHLKWFPSRTFNDTPRYLRKRERLCSRVVWKSQFPPYKLLQTSRRKETLLQGCLAISILPTYLTLYRKREDPIPGLPGDTNSNIYVPLKREKEGLVPELSGDLIFTQPFANLERQERSYLLFVTCLTSLFDKSASYRIQAFIVHFERKTYAFFFVTMMNLQVLSAMGAGSDIALYHSSITCAPIIVERLPFSSVIESTLWSMREMCRRAIEALGGDLPEQD